MMAAIVAPASGIRSRIADEQAERDRERHADEPEHDARRDAGDQADQQVAGDVAADRPVDVVADLAPARLLLLRDERRRIRSTHIGPSSSMKKVMKTIVSVATTAVTTLFVTVERRAGADRRAPTPPFLIASLTFSTMWYCVSRKPNRPRPCVRSVM